MSESHSLRDRDRDGTKFKILHVDDSPDFAEMAAEFLERKSDSMVVATETDAEGALERIRREGNGIDCVVSDYDMPHMDGVELLEEVRDEYPDLPFILFTGKGSEEVASEAISKGVTDYLQKGGGTDQYTVLANRIQNAVSMRRSERELEKYKSFVENSTDVITHLDGNGKILYQSPSVEKVFGYGQNETVGDNVFEYIHPDDREEMTEEFYSVLNDPETDVEEVELRMRTADGDYVWVEAVGGDHTETEAGGFVVNCRDISERKERERELERYEAIVENTTDLVTLIDENGTILYQSPSAERILGYDPEEAAGYNVFDLVHEDDREYLKEMFSGFMENPEEEIESVEYRFRHADGGYVWLEGSISDRRDTELEGFLVVARDITERKQNERELRRTKERFDLAIEGGEARCLGLGRKKRHS